MTIQYCDVACLQACDRASRVLEDWLETGAKPSQSRTQGWQLQREAVCRVRTLYTCSRRLQIQHRKSRTHKCTERTLLYKTEKECALMSYQGRWNVQEECGRQELHQRRRRSGEESYSSSDIERRRQLRAEEEELPCDTTRPRHRCREHLPWQCSEAKSCRSVHRGRLC